jgi:hypothetical protein
MYLSENEEAAELDALYEDEWFNRVIDVRCDECFRTARGAANELEKRFWTIGGISICPTHTALKVMTTGAFANVASFAPASSVESTPNSPYLTTPQH